MLRSQSINVCTTLPFCNYILVRLISQSEDMSECFSKTAISTNSKTVEKCSAYKICHINMLITC
jgi:hypothetical protein